MIHEIQEERRILLLFENLTFAFCTLVVTSHVVLEFRCRRMIRAFLAPHSWNVARSMCEDCMSHQYVTHHHQTCRDCMSHRKKSGNRRVSASAPQVQMCRLRHSGVHFQARVAVPAHAPGGAADVCLMSANPAAAAAPPTELGAVTVDGKAAAPLAWAWEAAQVDSLL